MDPYLANVLFTMAIAFVVFAFVFAIIEIANHKSGYPTFTTKSHPTIVILRRYKAIPERYRTEPYSDIKAKLKELDEFYGRDYINTVYACGLLGNWISRLDYSHPKSPREYEDLYKAVLAIEDAIKENRLANKPNAFYLTKSMSIDAEQIKRGSR